MKTSGKILHSFTSLFRNSSTSHKRKSNRKPRLLQLETLETRQLLTVPALSSDPSASVKIFLDFDGEDYSRQNIYVSNNLPLANMSAVPAFNLDNNVGPDSLEEARMIE
ncbi:MAG: hypothetical protein U0936_02960, partial [Planctomycetaceae bacterium]